MKMKMKMQLNSIKIITGIILLIFLSSCQQTNKKHQSLYEQLGGLAVIEAITINLVDRLFENKDIAFLFKDSDRQDLVEHVSKQICVLTGGHCEYKGRNMQEVHSGMEIRFSEFDVFVNEFIAAMEDTNIPFTQQNQVLALFAVMRDDVTHQ